MTYNFPCGSVLLKLMSGWSSLLLPVQFTGSKQRQLGYVNGDVLQPQVTYLNFKKWRTKIAVVKGWLINSMDPSLISNFIRFLTAEEVWDNIAITLMALTPHRIFSPRWRVCFTAFSMASFFTPSLVNLFHSFEPTATPVLKTYHFYCIVKLALLVHHKPFDGEAEAEELGELVVGAGHVDAGASAEDEMGYGTDDGDEGTTIDDKRTVDNGDGSVNDGQQDASFGRRDEIVCLTLVTGHKGPATTDSEGTDDGDEGTTIDDERSVDNGDGSVNDGQQDASFGRRDEIVCLTLVTGHKGPATTDSEIDAAGGEGKMGRLPLAK
ncbi:hypothetical protein RJ640_019354 [Escallonia rubra]|uniref:Uncharacterized protein n=1 Tax=Escallonia rubra TaxID=112253 RepID=A0AA88SG43_9ASTE|nr:hypothetical protein RJ640_019354 [Escallonia rubra]